MKINFEIFSLYKLRAARNGRLIVMDQEVAAEIARYAEYL